MPDPLAGERAVQDGPNRWRLAVPVGLLIVFWLVPGLHASRAAPAQTTDAAPIKELSTGIPDTIVDMQPFRTEQKVALGQSGSRVRLVALNRGTNAWFLLTVESGGSQGTFHYHIENPDPSGQQLHLAAGPPAALVITGKHGRQRCAPWAGDPAPLQTAQAGSLPYAPLCDGVLHLRNRVIGSRTNLERIAGFLRDHIWQGEEIVGFVRDTVFKDAFVESGKELAADALSPATDGPSPASIDPAYADQAVIPTDLGLPISAVPSGRMTLGHWYPVADMPGIHAAVIQPKALDVRVLAEPGRVNTLDSVEASALNYLVAFDLSQFELGFALGTDHPRLGWSPRVPAVMRDDKLSGPDGIATATPLVTTGMVNPVLAGHTVATFTGGFKREHGAFKYGDLSMRNHGTHYGFIEQGIVFSKLQPGLATLFVLNDGSVHMKTWSEEDNHLLSRIKFARQNGVALVEPDPRSGKPAAGVMVAKWGAGNWSGSANARLRTLRAGACLQEAAGKRYLVYGYFSTATPSAMARTFHAFGCSYAMLLDMNALEHTYLALYVRRNGMVLVEHLIPGMSAVDKTGASGVLIPRFIGFPDNRDFFYLVRRQGAP